MHLLQEHKLPRSHAMTVLGPVGVGLIAVDACERVAGVSAQMQMVRVLDIVSDYMRLRGYSHQRLDGSTPAAARHAGGHGCSWGSGIHAYTQTTRGTHYGCGVPHRMTAGRVCLSTWAGRRICLAALGTSRAQADSRVVTLVHYSHGLGARRACHSALGPLEPRDHQPHMSIISLAALWCALPCCALLCCSYGGLQQA